MRKLLLVRSALMRQSVFGRRGCLSFNGFPLTSRTIQDSPPVIVSWSSLRLPPSSVCVRLISSAPEVRESKANCSIAPTRGSPKMGRRRHVFPPSLVIRKNGSLGSEINCWPPIQPVSKSKNWICSSVVDRRRSYGSVQVFPLSEDDRRMEESVASDVCRLPLR